MADQAENPAVTPDAAPAAPVADAPAPVQVADSAAAPAESAPAAAPESAPAAAPEAPVSEPTLLEGVKAPGAEDAPAGDKPAEAAPAADAKPADAKAEPVKPEGEKPAEAAADKPADPAAEPAKPPVEPLEYKYELPETLKLDDTQRGELHQAFDAYRADPSNLQPLVDYHHARMQAYDEFKNREQYRIFNDTRKSWREEVMADPEIGGAGHHTAMQAIARMRDTFGSSHPAGTKEHAADLAAFDGFLRATGAGDHPIFLKMMHRFAQFADEPRMITAEIKPAPQPKMKGGSPLYDHPNSTGRQS